MKQVHRHSVRLAVVALTLFLVACGGGERNSPDAGRAGQSFRVALLTAGPVSDAGWYAGAYEGLLAIRDSMGAQVSHQQTRTPSEFDEAFRAFGAEGYDLVFAHGFEYQDAAIRAGELFPDMTIVVSGGGRVSHNVVPLVFTLEEGSYLAGMLAGSMTRTGTLGMVGGVAIPPVQGTFLAFASGAREVNPGVEVLESYIGNWDDVSAAKEATVAQIRRGADVIIHNTDAASFGVFQAAREATAAGDTAWAIGMNRDQNDVAPDVILGSAVIHIPRAFLETARRWQAGTLGGAPIYAGMHDGVIEFVVNPALAARIPSPVLGRLGRVEEEIRSGARTVPRVAFVEGEPGVP
ncbi:MAG: BMP family protein [Gemmatimonadota bacterium]